MVNTFKIFFLMGISLCLICHGPLKAQLSQKYAGYSENNYNGVRYGLFKPDKNIGPLPLVVYLHGSTDTVSHDLQFYQAPVQSVHPCYVLTPKCEEPNLGWGDSWHENHTSYMEKTLELIDSLVQIHQIDANRLYLYGISMGGFGVFSVLSKDPGKFAAAYAICGGSSEEVAGSLIDTPLWIFHGEIDDVVPVRLSRQIYDAIKKSGGNKVRFTVYPGVKHNSWENAGREEKLTRWLFLQKKENPTNSPDKVQNFLAKIQKDTKVKLSWQPPELANRIGNAIWFYRLYRNEILLAEFDSGNEMYVDSYGQKGTKQTYRLESVNYFFEFSIASQDIYIK